MLSEKYQRLYTAKVTTGQFPFDLPRLSEASVNHLLELSKTHQIDPTISEWMTAHGCPDEMIAAILPLVGRIAFEHELRYDLLARCQGQTEIVNAILQRSRRAVIGSRWTYERARAHLQETDPLLSRIARSDRLWEYWQSAVAAGQRPSQDTIRKMAEIERLESHIEPPLWMRLDGILHHRDPNEMYDRVLQQRGLTRDQMVHEIMGWRSECL